MYAGSITASDSTLVTVREESLHSEGAMLALVLTKTNAKWMGALLTPAEAHQLALHLYRWANSQDAALAFALKPQPLPPASEHQGSRRVNLADVAASAATCNRIGCKRRRVAGHFHCQAHMPREVAR